MNEVIIDGVNVAECKDIYGKEWINPQCLGDGAGWCKDHPNCYFKQLQRAKEENERLKNKVKKLEGDNYFLGIDKNEFAKQYFFALEDKEKLQKTIVDLKAEILKLKMKLDKYKRID